MALADGDTNEIVIGASAVGVGSNSVVLGNDSITKTILKGSVGIGTTSPGLALDVVGNARFSAIGSGASSGALYYTADGTLTTSSSDVRLKQNIVTIENPLDKVMALRGVTYNWKDPNSPKRMMGMIAQEVIGVAPELVFQNETDGYYGINYGETSGLLIEAIKEQQGEITSITENQNQIVKQLTGQLADQNLSVDNKLQLIGTSLSVLTSEQDEIIKDQIKNFKDSLSQSMQDTSEIKKNLKILEEQMTDLQKQNQAVIDFSTALNLDSLIYKNALGNLDLGDGTITAQDINITGKFNAKNIEAEEVIKGNILEISSQASGKAFIKAGEVEVEINSHEVSANNKIYITPISKLEGRNLYIDMGEIKENESFKVKMEGEVLESDINFNWLIIK